MAALYDTFKQSEMVGLYYIMTSKKSSNSSGQGRTRNFASILYPDSAPDNWYSLLSAELVPAFISPLHSLDINPTGEAKKPHFHILLMFEGVKTIDQARCIFDKIGAVGCEKVNSLRGYARYLCHLDNPEKAQYDSSEVLSLCGADYSEIISLNSDRYKLLGELIDFCELNDIQSFSELVVYSRVHRPDWFRLLADNSSVFVSQYLKSRSWTAQNRGDRDE